MGIPEVFKASRRTYKAVLIPGTDDYAIVAHVSYRKTKMTTCNVAVKGFFMKSNAKEITQCLNDAYFGGLNDQFHHLMK